MELLRTTPHSMIIYTLSSILVLIESLVTSPDLLLVTEYLNVIMEEHKSIFTQKNIIFIAR